MFFQGNYVTVPLKSEVRFLLMVYAESTRSQSSLKIGFFPSYSTIQVPAEFSISILISNTTPLKVRQKPIFTFLKITMLWLLSHTGKGSLASPSLSPQTEWIFEYLSWLFRQITTANHIFRDEFLENLMPWSEKAQENC